MRIVVEVLPYDDPSRRVGYRWSVAGDGVPELDGLQWNARKPSSIERFARMLSVRHGVEAWMLAHGKELLLFRPTPEAVAEFNRTLPMSLQELGVDLSSRRRAMAAAPAGSGPELPFGGVGVA